MTLFMHLHKKMRSPKKHGWFCLNGHNSKKNILHLKNKKRPAQIFMHKKSWGGSSSSSSRIVCYENCIVHAFFILMAAAELRK